MVQHKSQNIIKCNTEPPSVEVATPTLTPCPKNGGSRIYQRKKCVSCSLKVSGEKNNGMIYIQTEICGN